MTAAAGLSGSAPGQGARRGRLQPAAVQNVRGLCPLRRSWEEIHRCRRWSMSHRCPRWSHRCLLLLVQTLWGWAQCGRERQVPGYHPQGRELAQRAERAGQVGQAGQAWSAAPHSGD